MIVVVVDIIITITLWEIKDLTKIVKTQQSKAVNSLINQVIKTNIYPIYKITVSVHNLHNLGKVTLFLFLITLNLISTVHHNNNKDI